MSNNYLKAETAAVRSETVTSCGYEIELERFGISNDGTNALQTTAGLQEALLWAKQAGYKNCGLPSGTYLIDATYQTSSINVPCGIKMSGGLVLSLHCDTVLTEQANSFTSGSMVLFENVEGGGIVGGTLKGDRDAHNYSASGAHESAHILIIRNSKNILLSDINFEQATGDCICIGGGIRYGEEGYVRPYNITVRGCSLDGARRNNLSIIDCDTCLIENNKIANAGRVSGSSSGPWAGIDTEANFSSADYENWQIVKHVSIKSNVFENNRGGGLNLNNAHYSLVSDNIFKDNCALSYGRCGTVSGNLIYNASLTILHTGDTENIFEARMLICDNHILDGVAYIAGKSCVFSGNVVRGQLQLSELQSSSITNNTIYYSGYTIAAAAPAQKSAIYCLQNTVTADNKDRLDFHCTDNIISNNNIILLKNGTAESGESYGIRVYWHCSGKSLIIANNTITNFYTGVQIGGAYTNSDLSTPFEDITLTGNTIKSDLANSYGITSRQFIISTSAEGVQTRAYCSPVKLLIEQNTVKIGKNCLSISSPLFCTKLTIRKNIFECANMLMDIQPRPDDEGNRNEKLCVDITGNECKTSAGSGTAGVYLANACNAKIINNLIDSDNKLTGSIKLVNCLKTRLVNNIVNGGILKDETTAETGTVNLSQ